MSDLAPPVQPPLLLPPSSPQVAPSTSYSCATGDIGGQTCDCSPGWLFYGPRYINELSTIDSSQWITASTIEMMVATGLSVGYKPSGIGKCWFKKGFLDLHTGVAFGAIDPLPGIGSTNRQCFCRIFKPAAPPSSPPPLPPLVPQSPLPSPPSPSPPSPSPSPPSSPQPSSSPSPPPSLSLPPPSFIRPSSWLPLLSQPPHSSPPPLQPQAKIFKIAVVSCICGRSHQF